MEIKIRKMESTDLMDVCTIRNYYINNSTANLTLEPTPFDVFAANTDLNDKKYTKLVAIVDNKVAGYAMANPYRNSGYFKTSELSIYIDENYKCLGLGKMLLTDIEKSLIENGFMTITSYITSDNKGSINFHLRNGFEVVGTLKQVGVKKNKIYDVVILQKLLNKK